MPDPDVTKEYCAMPSWMAHWTSGATENFWKGSSAFPGEMESIIAIDQAIWLTQKEKSDLMKLARPTRESADHFYAWQDRILGPRPTRDRDAGGGGERCQRTARCDRISGWDCVD